MRQFIFTLFVLGCGVGQSLRAQPLATNDINPAIELWTYPNAPGKGLNRIPIFAYLGDDSGEDTRMGQDVFGWTTASLIPTNQTPTHYIVRRCRVTLTVKDDATFTYDPTHDDYQTYLETNDPAYQEDADAGRPVELFGLNYRNGYDAYSFNENSPFGDGAPGGRNAYPVSWATNGVFADVSNNVGKTNVDFPPFEAWPFAVGQFTNVAPGDLVPAGSKMFFDLDVNDPAVVTYLQNSLNIGVLNFDVTSLHSVLGMTGPDTYPAFSTHFNTLAPTSTRLELEVSVIRDLDTDNDGLPDDWEMFYFGNLDQGANDDPDHDGVSNLNEYLAGTDPTKADSAFYLVATSASTLRWPNLPSRQFIVQYSDDLKTWETVSNAAVIYPTPSTATWTDPHPSATNRFYRVRAMTP